MRLKKLLSIDLINTTPMVNGTLYEEEKKKNLKGFFCEIKSPGYQQVNRTEL